MTHLVPAALSMARRRVAWCEVHGMTWKGATCRDTAQRSAAQRSAAQHSTAQHSTIQHTSQQPAWNRLALPRALRAQHNKASGPAGHASRRARVWQKQSITSHHRLSPISSHHQAPSTKHHTSNVIKHQPASSSITNQASHCKRHHASSTTTNQHHRPITACTQARRPPPWEGRRQVRGQQGLTTMMPPSVNPALLRSRNCTRCSAAAAPGPGQPRYCNSTDS
jgi:hypothetical protein